MIQLRREDLIHKAVMYRLLIQIADNHLLSQELYFKGGTCAMMLEWLDRFSIDLDFDLRDINKKELIRKEMHLLVKKSGFTIKQEAKDSLFFVFKYDFPNRTRNTLKLSIVDNPPRSNQYTAEFFSEIDRYLCCQTKETMFANKLVAVIDRYKAYKIIAGRDIYDLHYFFQNGYLYNEIVIEERTKIDAKSYLKKLIDFIEKKVTMTIIEEDLNYLLPEKQFAKIKKTLKPEVLIYLKHEVKRY